MRSRRNKLQSIINSLPITLFLGTVCFDWVTTWLDLSDDQYKDVFYVGVELIGSSLYTNLVLLAVVVRYRLCLYNYVAVIGLFYINLVNIFSMQFSSYDFYESYYNHSITVLFFLTSIYLLIRKI